MPTAPMSHVTTAGSTETRTTLITRTVDTEMAIEEEEGGDITSIVTTETIIGESGAWTESVTTSHHVGPIRRERK